VADGLRVTIRGVREVQRALDKLPEQANAEFRRGMGLLAGRFTRTIRAAGKADSRQSARAASTVRSQVNGTSVVVSAGPHPLLFGSEFGAKRRFGWYANRRYAHSPERQFRPHLGSGSYWFFRTVDEHRDEVDREGQAIADRVIARWSA
jgi:hypothetical protein